jgi:FkbM family methyltransferase
MWMKNMTTSSQMNSYSLKLSSGFNDYDYHVDDACKQLPSIRPAGSYFLDSKIRMGSSPAEVTPSFNVGTIFDSSKVTAHMGTDIDNFHLMREILKDKKGGLAFDFGANQGFYTYYLAALGLEVHSFEINENNFKALQHGAEFNNRDIADRVHVYPVGLGLKNSRFDMKGSNYDGFLKDSKTGSILGASFDCFAHHMRGKMDMSEVAFVKLDVEGFETAVLKGAQNSLFKYSKIGGFLTEVGPNRWNRAAVDFSTGLEEMQKLSSHFKTSYILLRTKHHEGSCPVTMGEGILSDKKPRIMDNVHVFKVKMNEWEPLLKIMEEKGYDCNFLYKNA